MKLKTKILKHQMEILTMILCFMFVVTGALVLYKNYTLQVKINDLKLQIYEYELAEESEKWLEQFR